MNSDLQVERVGEKSRHCSMLSPLPRAAVRAALDDRGSHVPLVRVCIWEGRQQRSITLLPFPPCRPSLVPVPLSISALNNPHPDHTSLHISECRTSVPFRFSLTVFYRQVLSRRWVALGLYKVCHLSVAINKLTHTMVSCNPSICTSLPSHLLSIVYQRPRDAYIYDSLRGKESFPLSVDLSHTAHIGLSGLSS
jgi:hypothetical protein